MALPETPALLKAEYVVEILRKYGNQTVKIA
jgi:hypothetical protein